MENDIDNGLGRPALDEPDMWLVPAIPGLVLILGYIDLDGNDPPTFERHPIAVWRIMADCSGFPAVLTTATERGPIALFGSHDMGIGWFTTIGILTPDGSVYWEGEAVPVDAGPIPAADFEDIATKHMIAQRERYRRMKAFFKRYGADRSSEHAIAITVKGFKSEEIPF